MRQEQGTDGFRLAYDRAGQGPGAPAVVLLHGWPGDRTDYREVVPLLTAVADVVVPDLRGFGESDKHPPGSSPAGSQHGAAGSQHSAAGSEKGSEYSAAAQARGVIGLIGDLGLRHPVIAGYDIGSRIAQAIARDQPGLPSALVLSPPLPGIGDRILGPAAQREFWYQAFHGLDLCTELIDGRPDAVRAYLRHFWSHWSGPDFTLAGSDLDHLVSAYGSPGAFAASIAWYRAGAGSVAVSVAEQAPAPDDRLAVPATVLWPDRDPLFPFEWSDRLGDFFAAATVTRLRGAGHFTPLERPQEFAAAITAALAEPTACGQRL